MSKYKPNKNINKVKSHAFPHGTYRIHWKKPYKCNGLCTNPKDRQIWINPNVDDKELIKIIIDEGIHAGLWALDNDYVDEMSESIGEFLYKIGFRVEKKTNKKNKK